MAYGMHQAPTRKCQRTIARRSAAGAAIRDPEQGRGMIQEMPADDVPVMFSARAWNSSQESWDDYIRALERAYAQYVERARGTMIEDQTRCAADPDDQGS